MTKLIELKISFKQIKKSVEDATFLWLIAKKNKKNGKEQQAMICEILSVLGQNISEVATNHKASRLIQDILRKSSQSNVKMVLRECSPRLLTLANSPYGNFVVKTLIANSSKKTLSDIHKCYTGHIYELLKDPHGITVLNKLFNASEPHLKNLMLNECYCQDLILPDSKNCFVLKELLSNYPRKRNTIITSIAMNMSRILEKKLTNSIVFHRILAEYIDHASPKAIYDIANSLSPTTIRQMICTKEGAHISISILSILTLKRREEFHKTLKGKILDLARRKTGRAFFASLMITEKSKHLTRNLIKELNSEHFGIKSCHVQLHLITILLSLIKNYKNRYSAVIWRTISPIMFAQNTSPCYFEEKRLMKAFKKIEYGIYLKKGKFLLIKSRLFFDMVVKVYLFFLGARKISLNLYFLIFNFLISSLNPIDVSKNIKLSRLFKEILERKNQFPLSNICDV